MPINPEFIIVLNSTSPCAPFLIPLPAPLPLPPIPAMKYEFFITLFLTVGLFTPPTLTASLLEYKTVEFSNLKFEPEALIPSIPEKDISQFCTVILLPPLISMFSLLVPLKARLSNNT